MSRNSIGRDIYEAKLKGKDATETMKLLMASPYKKHRERARRVLQIAEALDEIQRERAAADAAEEAPDATAL